MTHEEKRKYLIKELLTEQPRYSNFEIPAEGQGQKDLLRSLMNVRMLAPALATGDVDRGGGAVPPLSLCLFFIYFVGYAPEGSKGDRKCPPKVLCTFSRAPHGSEIEDKHLYFILPGFARDLFFGLSPSAWRG